MESKRGLSAIVATMLIILLTIVAVGVIWAVIRGVVNSGGEQIELNTKCVSVNLEAVTVVETSAGIYNVTLSRGSDSQGDIGVKVNILQGNTISSGVANFGVVGDLDALGTVTKSIATSPSLPNADKVEFTAFFLDSSGNEQLCTQTGTFEF